MHFVSRKSDSHFSLNLKLSKYGKLSARSERLYKAFVTSKK